MHKDSASRGHPLFDTVFGLPVHALVVHVVVVLLPLAAVGGAVVAVLPWARERYLILITAIAIAVVPAVIVATKSGQQLQDRLNRTFGPGSAQEAQLMEEHVRLGKNLLPWAIVLAAALVLLLAAVYLRRRPESPSWLRAGGYAASAAVLVGSVLSIYWTVRIGDAGARAAWTDVVQSSN